MKNFIIFKFLSFFTLFFLIAFPNFAKADTKNILFYGEGCPHCKKVEDFIKKNQLNEKITSKEVYHNPQNANEFNQICEKENISLMNRGVPFLYTENDECIIGDKEIISYLKNLNKQNKKSENNTLKTSAKNKKNTKSSKNLNKIDLAMIVGAALTDAINPCAFAVLIILISTILINGNKKKALKAGLLFSLSIFISYFLMGLGVYSLSTSFAGAKFFTKTIAVLAILIGLFNLKDYFWYGKFFIMEVPLSWRPKLKKTIQSVTGPIGAFIIGFLVSLFLLPCTSGPYIVIIGMLSKKALYSKAVALLLFYNFIFILPMILISVASYFGLNIEKAEKLRQKKLKLLHLIAGLIMLIMGLYLLFN